MSCLRYVGVHGREAESETGATSTRATTTVLAVKQEKLGASASFAC
jgi:hypothetical protein